MKKAITIEGREFDLERLNDFESWDAREDIVTLWDKNERKIIDVRVATLIGCWIEKEKNDWEEANS